MAKRKPPQDTVAKQWIKRLKQGLGYMKAPGPLAGKSEAELKSGAQGITAVVMAEYLAMSNKKQKACARQLLAELEEPLQRAGLDVDIDNPDHIHGLIEQAAFSLLLQARDGPWDSLNDLNLPALDESYSDR